MDAYDDLATARCPKKVVAVIPAHGRFPLLRVTIERLLKRNGVNQVVVVGDQHEVKAICRQTGAHYVEFKNRPLGRKWNWGFHTARDMKPDACLFVGSSDWISDTWIPDILPLTDEYDLIGKPDFYLLDIGPGNTLRACHWPGYGDHRPARKYEPIGIGRVISARMLDEIKWMPFDPAADNSMDWQMYQKVLKAGGKVHLVTDESLRSLSISTYQWVNKHKFDEHHSGRLTSRIIEDPEAFARTHFPEALTLFNENKTSVHIPLGS